MMWPRPDDESFFNPQRRFPATDDPDVRLTCQIADHLLANAVTRRQRVTVEVRNRVVILSGTADTPSLKQAVADVARNTEGVVDVCNALHVAQTGKGEEAANRLHHERNALERGDRTADEQRFQNMIAALQTEDPSWAGRFVKPIRRSTVVAWAAVAVAVVAWAAVAVAVVAWAAMSVLMVRFG